MSFEKLSKFGLKSNDKVVLLGGLIKSNETTTTTPSTTMMDQVQNPGCSDSQTFTDDDKGTILSKCTTYNCPD
jgi:hypothetical protein